MMFLMRLYPELFTWVPQEAIDIVVKLRQDEM